MVHAGKGSARGWPVPRGGGGALAHAAAWVTMKEASGEERRATKGPLRKPPAIPRDWMMMHSRVWSAARGIKTTTIMKIKFSWSCRAFSRSLVPAPALPIAFIALILGGVLSSSSVVKADPFGRMWSYAQTTTHACGSVLETDSSNAAGCIIGDGLNLLADEGVVLANEAGKKVFGQYFQISGDMGWSPTSFGAGLDGVETDLDMVIPLASSSTLGNQHIESSLFFQQGITRWRDYSEMVRNDLRHGVTHRFRVSGSPDADIVGMSAFFLHSMEHGHQVALSSIDYVGNWGAGSFRWFIPTTGWRFVRPGLQERALEGMELGVRVNLTTAVDLNAVTFRWEDEDGSGGYTRGARMGLNWRPHPWLALDARYSDVSVGDNSAAIGVRLAIPLGPKSSVPRWTGLGVATENDGPDNEELFRAVEDVGRIRVATRSSPTTASQEDVGVRFLDANIGSGENVEVEVFISSPASSDIVVIVRLEPGDGENPAVAGEDFIDEPVEATIVQGTTSTVISIPLIRNDDMEEPRSLGVRASIAS